MQELAAEKERLSQLEVRHQRVNLAYVDVKSQVQHGDYKIENYDHVKMSVLTMSHVVVTCYVMLIWWWQSSNQPSTMQNILHAYYFQTGNCTLPGKINIDTSQLQSLLVPHVPFRSLQSSHAPRLTVPRTRTVFASHAFSVAALTVWNSLYSVFSSVFNISVVNSDTLATFKKRLKTHLFSCVTWNVLATEHLCISYYGAIQVFIFHSSFVLHCLISTNKPYCL